MHSCILTVYMLTKSDLKQVNGEQTCSPKFLVLSATLVPVMPIHEDPPPKKKLKGLAGVTSKSS